MAMYFNIFLYPVWAIGTLCTIVQKFHAYSLSDVQRFFSLLFYVSFVVMEPARLYLGYCGNLMEKIPHLAGFLLLTLCPIVPSVVYYIYIQRFSSVNVPVYPFEIGINLLYFAFVCVEVYLSYQTTHRLISIAWARGQVYSTTESSSRNQSISTIQVGKSRGVKRELNNNNNINMRISRSARVNPSTE